MTRILLRLACLLSLAFAFAASAQAQTRAWVDRDQVALGDTLTLNIETDQATASAPDYSALVPDFVVSGNTSSRQVEIVNGKTRVRVLFAVALQPRREGLTTIPSLQVGNAHTQPIALTVTAAAPAARAGGAAFIETEVDSQSPYVQQAVGFTVRLYYQPGLVSGQLDQPEPDGAALQRIGDDLQYSREVGGKRYQVVERRFLLVPERSGTLTIPGAHFQGRGVSGFFDDMFGASPRELRANAAPRVLGVRPVPADAPQPWLPLHALGLRYVSTPQTARAGEAATVVVELRADGATATQLPELQLPAVDGAQVFADPPQSDESFDNGRPQVKLTRKFSIVPSRPGALHIPGPHVGWWDVRAGTARNASLPDLQLQVAPGAAGSATPAMPVDDTTASSTTTDTGRSVMPASGTVRPWAIATIAFALLWLGTLVWALQRRSTAHSGHGPPSAIPDAAAAGVRSTPTLRELKHALDIGDLGDVAQVLCAMAPGPPRTLDGVLAQLDDAAQAEAVRQLQRARWGDGDGSAARTALRAALGDGPRWKQTAKPAQSVLPPLYPE